MIAVVKGDLFKSNAQTLVNTVNCVGVMGKGIALGFKRRFPEMYEDYVRRCEAREVKLGEPYLYRSLLPPWVLNFPTKDHWRSVARLADITAGLDCLATNYQDWGIESLAVPPLGCGEGQLDWRVVGRTLYRRLAELDIDVELYAPFDTPDAELKPDFLITDGADLPADQFSGGRWTGATVGRGRCDCCHSAAGGKRALPLARRSNDVPEGCVLCHSGTHSHWTRLPAGQLWTVR